MAGLRGFASPEEHDEVILQNWNKQVKKGDRGFILGDFAMRWDGVEEKLARMNGEIILIEGNHDIMSCIHRDGWKHVGPWIGEGKFASIIAFGRRKIAGRQWLMSHYPYEGDHTPDDRFTQYRLRDEGLWLLHGHTHLKNKVGPNRRRSLPLFGQSLDELRWYGQEIHVGVDAWDLCPVPEPAVTELIDRLDRA